MRRYNRDLLLNPNEEELKAFGITKKEAPCMHPGRGHDTPEDLDALARAVKNYKRIWWAWDDFENESESVRRAVLKYG